MTTPKTFTCVNPTCGTTLDHHHDQGPGGPGEPTDDFHATAVCFHCATPAVIDSHGNARPPTPEERAAIEGSDGYRQAMAKRRRQLGAAELGWLN